MASSLEPWQRCWQKAVAPRLSLEQLEALARGLRKDDPQLIQRALFESRFDGGVGACAVAYALCHGRPAEKSEREIGEAFETFAIATGSLDPFLAWFDDTPRATAFATLLPLVEAAIDDRLNPHSVKELP